MAPNVWDSNLENCSGDRKLTKNGFPKFKVLDGCIIHTQRGITQLDQDTHLSASGGC